MTRETGLNLGVSRSVIPALVVLAACSAQSERPDAGGSPWAEGPALPGPRLEPGVTALGQRLVIAGGFVSTVTFEATKEVWVLERTDQLASAMWTRLTDTPMAAAWTHINLAGVGGSLYLLGGSEGFNPYVAHGESYVLAAGSSVWRLLAPMPAGEERSAAGVVVSPPHIYLLGGAGTNAAVASCLDYNITTNTWTVLPPLPSPRSHPAAMRRPDGTLIVAGGLATLDASQPLSEVWALPLNATTWERRAPAHTARGGCAYGTAFGKLICAGGEAGITALATTEVYDPILDRWTDEPDMPAPRAGTQGAVIGSRLFVPGGSPSLSIPEATSTLYVFSLLDTIASHGPGSASL